MAGAATEARGAVGPVETGPTLLAFADAAGVPRRWLLLSGGAVVGRGDEIAELPGQREWVRVVLAVPGVDVAMHWLELDEGLTSAQAAAAARLQLADEAAEPIGDMHLAAGRAEAGLTAVAVAPAERIAAWIESARALAMEPEVIIPAPMLLLPPVEGLACYLGGEVPDYRGTARAFSVEDALAALIVGDERVREIGDNEREAGLGPVLAQPPINLRQGAFVRRREFVLDWARVRWLTILGLILLLVSLAIQIVIILRTTAAADQYEREALATRQATPGGARQPTVGFGTLATALFEAVRETPNVEVSQIVYQPDGSLRANVLADTQATIDALRARIEARGMQAAGGLPTNLGGRAAGEITMRPR